MKLHRGQCEADKWRRMWEKERDRRIAGDDVIRIARDRIHDQDRVIEWLKGKAGISKAS